MHELLLVWARASLYAGSLRTVTAAVMDGKGQILSKSTLPHWGPSVSYGVCHTEAAVSRLPTLERRAIIVYYLGTGPVCLRLKMLGMKPRDFYNTLARARCHLEKDMKLLGLGSKV